MKKNCPARDLLAALLVVMALAGSSVTHALESFTVEDIRVEGVQKIDPGTVFNYLPVKVGDLIDDGIAREAIKALYATGFFQDIELRQEGTVLIVVVVERPSIARVEYSGNKDIRDKAIDDALAQTGVTEGRIFNERQLEQLAKVIQERYFSRGRYSAEVEAVATPLDLNRVAVTLEIDEGRIARIKKINIIGNESFSESDLIDAMLLSEESWHSFITQSGQYSSEKLQADVEILRSYYLDRGFMKFEVLSTDVSISQNKQDIFLAVSISEGDRYTVGGITVEAAAGFSPAELLALVEMPRGEAFSQRALVAARLAIEDRLAENGYAFANVNAIPDLDKELKEVSFLLAVDPGPLVYVRQINIQGNEITRDEVIRREIRQLEASVYSAADIRRSRQRIQRLGFFDEVAIDTAIVPGAVDQVDLNIAVTERSTGNFMFGIGYSDADGALFQTEIVRENLFGTGRGLKFKFDYSKVEQVFDIEYRNPYQTPEGISQALFLRKDAIDTEQSANADYTSDTLGAGIRYRIPISEYNALNLSAAFEQIALSETESTPAEYISFIDRFPDNTNVNLTLGVSKDTRDSIFFPAEGYLRRISVQAAVPGSDLEYFKMSLRGSWHRELLESVVLGLRGDLGYGAGYRDQQELPFFKNYFAGGANSVRGHDARSLGPRSSNSNNDALGGNKRLVGNAEVLVPVPGMVDSPDKRLSLFFDGGQVFGNDQSFDISDLRFSAGVGFHWFSPVGPISLTYALPLNDEPGDDVEKFQFTLGAVFR